MATLFVHISDDTYQRTEDMTEEEVTAALEAQGLTGEFIDEAAYTEATFKGRLYAHRSDGVYVSFEGMTKAQITAMLSEQELTVEYIDAETYKTAIAEQE